MILRYFLPVLIFFVTFSYGDDIDISLLGNPTSILLETKVFIDKENKKSFDYIVQDSATIFKPNTRSLIHQGYSNDAVWLKLIIKNSSEVKIHKILEVSNNMLDDIYLFSKSSDGTYSKNMKGVMHQKTFDENILNFYFDIELESGEVKHYYMKVASLSCSLYFELNLMSKDQLYQKELQHQLILALFFGSIITLIIYNLFIYIFTKDLSYLYYTLYISFIGWNHLSYTTMNFHILPLSFSEIDTFLTIFYLNSISVFALLFTREFLNIKRFKRLDFVLKLFVAINIIFILVTSKEFYPIDIVVYCMLITLIYMLSLSVFLSFKREKNAQLIVGGWGLVSLPLNRTSLNGIIHL